MLVAAIALFAGLSCPKDFGVLETTIGAFNTSSALNICASKAEVFSSGGKIVLVLGGTLERPRCLNYPGGRAPDLTSLLLSDHVGCFSLYPPTQSVAVVNLGGIASPKLSSAMAKFAPALVRSFVSPPTTVLGQRVAFSSTASSSLVRGTLLGLPIKAHFGLAATNWQFNFADGAVSTSSARYPSLVMNRVGAHTAKLQVGFASSFQILGSQIWHSVAGVISRSAQPLPFYGIEALPPAKSSHRRPVLVARDCDKALSAYGCSG